MIENSAILHVDGSFSEYLDSKKDTHYFAGFGAYLVVHGKIKDKFSQSSNVLPFLFRHEEHAILESLKWVLNKNINHLSIKSDSISAINLFTGQKKPINKDDRFLLMNFILLENLFEYIELEYVSRNSDDLSHQLSRNYMKDIPPDFIQVEKSEHKAIPEDIKSKNIKSSICKTLIDTQQLYKKI